MFIQILCKSVVLALLLSSTFATAEKLSDKKTKKTELEISNNKFEKEITKEQRLAFSYARSLKILMPPIGNIQIQGWKKREIYIQAKFKIAANNQEDLDLLSKNIGYLLNQDSMTWQITSISPNIKMTKEEKKRIGKNILEKLAKTSYSIDYIISVPEYTDLDIEHSSGDIELKNLYGMVNFTSQKSKVRLDELNGTIVGRVATGEAQINLAGHSWRGNGVDIQFGIGNIVLNIPSLYSTALTLTATSPINVNYPIVRGENELPDAPIGNVLQTSLGNGGASLRFTTKLGEIHLNAVN